MMAITTGSATITLTGTQLRALDKLPPRVAGALSRFVERLLARFDDQIHRLSLYGSFARGETHTESDVDVLVVVGWEEERLPDGWYRSPYSDPRWQAIIDIAVESTLESERYFSPLVVSETLFQLSRGDAVESARQEGITLYVRPSGFTSAGKALARIGTDTAGAAAATDHAWREDVASGYGEGAADLDDPRLWLSLADEKLLVARELASASHYNDAISRLYYAMFYAARAALLSIGVSIKSHQGALSRFGRFFVKTGWVDARFEALLSRANEDRLRSDYKPKSRPVREDVEQALRDADAFIAKARELVEEELSKRGISLS
jgi:uncharacterized protein (UPF0332 family)/predicted nucleotidyltransferase